MRGLRPDEREALLTAAAPCDGSITDDGCDSNEMQGWADLEKRGYVQRVTHVLHKDGREYIQDCMHVTELGRIALSLWPVNRSA